MRRGAGDDGEALHEDDRATLGWRVLLAEAIGVGPNEMEVSWIPVLDDRAERMLVALRAARDELGRSPTTAESELSGRRPSSRTFRRHFGGWREACWVAMEDDYLR